MDEKIVKKPWLRKTKNHKPEKPHVYSKKENGKNATGAPTKYKPEYCERIIDFFSRPITRQVLKSENTITGKKEYATAPAELPTFFAFARSIGVWQETLLDWCVLYKEFRQAFNAAKELQKSFLVNNGLAGLYPPASFIFVSKNITDMRDKVETEVKFPDLGDYD